jgi:hypothetical protein
VFVGEPVLGRTFSESLSEMEYTVVSMTGFLPNPEAILFDLLVLSGVVDLAFLDLGVVDFGGALFDEEGLRVDKGMVTSLSKDGSEVGGMV